MNQQSVYQKIVNEPQSVSWLDLLKESFTAHSKKDYSQALQAGTLPSTASRSNPLGSWRLPFLWWPLAKYGIILILGMYGILYTLIAFDLSITNSLVVMSTIIPPIVIPLVIMILLWELNVPQDVSLFEMGAMFVAGGVLTFVFTSLMFQVVKESGAVYAGLREEPGKLAASLAIMFYLQYGKRKKINGFTGLMVGAAVGAAFSGFESVTYAMNALNNSHSWEQMAYVQLLRAVYAIAGHITYCVPYSVAIGLNTQKGQITLKSLLHPLTLFAFALSVGMHTMWNSTNVEMIQVALSFAGLFILQFWFRQCLVQYIGTRGNREKNDPIPESAPAGGSVCLMVVEGPMKGTSWKSSGDPIYLGRDRSKCRVCFPDDTRGISRIHCCVCCTDQGWVIQDLNSSFGTYLYGRRLPAYEAVLLKPGDVFHLGTKRIAIKVQ